MHARKAAFLSSVRWRTTPVHKKLAEWTEKERPSLSDIALAKEIALGSIKRWISLEYLLQDLLPKRYTQEEKLLFFQAGYQFLFMDSIPLYAIVSQTVDIARERFGSNKAKLFNAILRKLPERVRSLHEKEEDLSIFYSYPPCFVEKLLLSYGNKQTKELLKTMNAFYSPSCRVRKKVLYPMEILFQNHLIAAKPSKEVWSQLLKDPAIYIQNVTFIYLMDYLFSKQKEVPKKILDLCAAPGGKTLILADLYPNASITANDIGKEKLLLLQENREKYQSHFTITSHPAEKYPLQEKYDLILLDAPCSGSGVLGKRAEARYRLTPKQIQEQIALQKKMIQRALSLLTPKGALWYMTCSILPEENEEMAEYAKSLGLHLHTTFLQLPNPQGWDGGYAALSMLP